MSYTREAKQKAVSIVPFPPMLPVHLLCPRYASLTVASQFVKNTLLMIVARSQQSDRAGKKHTAHSSVLLLRHTTCSMDFWP